MRITILFENHSGFKKGFFGGHGFSALVEHKGYKILVDTGVDGEILLKNMNALGIKPADIDYLFLTHGHYDHTEGLKALLEARGGKKLTIIAHPEIFVKRVALKPHLRDISLPFKREQLEELGAEFILTRDPIQIIEGIYSSGEIERVTWDRAVGYKIENGKLVKDEVKDDMALILDLGDSIAVITGCGHSGVINIAMHAQKLMNKPIKVLIGGFHLIGAKPEILKETVEKLNELKVEKLYAGHCTGFEAMSSFMIEFGKAFEPLYVGKAIELG
ncbi:MAG: MBL fold metallo-hydrolase [Thermococcus sp.]|uniref:MBL fold metallo-hydrolase n=1 Tax=Thermococcus sp. TaxID=35749 RepID=UPI001E12B67A|nr:MBL fold metallo-hydrolase [Thermococcus sp.]MBO8175314.1 MBL fold metallo-hydrolase [Thermococcus sp.]